jgi:hypothetical protein
VYPLEERYWLVEYNDVSRSTDYFTVFGGYTVLRNNYLHDTDPSYWENVGGGEDGFHIDAFQQGSGGTQTYHRNVVYESNYVGDFTNFYHCHGVLIQDQGENGDTDIILRGNVFHNMWGGAIGGYAIDHVKMYHNTTNEMNQNGIDGSTFIMYTFSGDVPEYAVCINNLLANDDSDDPMNMNDGSPVCEYNVGYLAGSDSSYVSTSDPLFTNSSTGDLTLSSTSSSAYGAGTSIATVTSATGSGTSFTVASNISNRFTNGYGIVRGDMIIVGSNDPVEITGISGTTITVASSISWTNGDDIYWRDDSKDIGAYPYRSGGYSVTCTLTNPTDSGFVSGTEVVTATVSDSDIVRFVEFFIDGLPVDIVNDSPYTYSWDTSGLAFGSSHKVEARAYPLYASKTIYDADTADVTVGTGVSFNSSTTLQFG